MENLESTSDTADQDEPASQKDEENGNFRLGGREHYTRETVPAVRRRHARVVGEKALVQRGVILEWQAYPVTKTTRALRGGVAWDFLGQDGKKEDTAVFSSPVL